MACTSCGTGGGCGTTGSSGCGKSGGCSSGGCNKLNSYDWLGNMEMDNSKQFNIIEVKFKGGRKEYLRNSNKLELFTGDAVIIDVPNGHHLGHVSLQGELVRLQMKKKVVVEDDTMRVVYRKATTKDIEKYDLSRSREETTLYRTRHLAREMKLAMKLSDVEFQADNTKATFYYSAEERVDFRELIKALASEFKIRVEMKQISLRQEASRLGGIGSCGRELCCSTWLTDFKNVNTSAARYQNLALNPTKLSGQCGRLKCCLNYELDTYMHALKGIPEIEQPISTLRGDAVLQKTDIFKRKMWFAYRDDITTWIPITVDRVNEILIQNKNGAKPATLEADTVLEKGASREEKKEKEELSRFDDKFSKKKKRKKSKGSGNNTNFNAPNTNITPVDGNSALDTPPVNNNQNRNNQNRNNNNPNQNRNNNNPNQNRNQNPNQVKNNNPNRNPNQVKNPNQNPNQNQVKNNNQNQIKNNNPNQNPNQIKNNNPNQNPNQIKNNNPNQNPNQIKNNNPNQNPNRNNNPNQNRNNNNPNQNKNPNPPRNTNIPTRVNPLDIKPDGDDSTNKGPENKID